MENSFVENINSLANATSLAVGDIVEDTQTARDEAVAAAVEASLSSLSASDSSLSSEDWANKGYNNPVEGTPGVDAEFSSYHWAVQSSLNVGDPIINDDTVSVNYTWSSDKLNTDISNKSDISHLHTGIYEPAFSKGTAFNKNFTPATGDNGTSIDVSRGNHTHTATYEPKRTTQGTAYNKNFGITSGDVADGAHDHDTDYMPLSVIETAYNKPFVVDPNAPLVDEVPRGNHTHQSSGILYDNTNNKIITSSTNQGAISQLDSVLGSVVVAEKSKLNAGLTDPSYTIVNSGIGLPNIINAGMTIGTSSKNAIYNNGIQINYPTAPDKLVEGRYTVVVSILTEISVEYALGLMINGIEVDTSLRSETGSSINGIAGTFSVSISVWASSLENLDTIQAVMYSSSANNIVIESMVISWDGQPEGALVTSGIIVAHSDTTGRDVTAQHPTSSIHETGNTGVSLDTLLTQKADKVITPVLDNLLAMDINGNLKDSGVAISDTTNHMDKISLPTLDNIVVTDAAGQSKDGGFTISALAKKNGDVLETFKVANSIVDTDATNQGQINALAATYTTQVEFDVHEAAVNPHMTTYSDVGAAPLAHVHTITNVTGLQDELDDRYVKVVIPVTDNLLSFGSGGILEDSGVAITQISDNTTAIAINTEKIGVTTEVDSDISGITGADRITNMISLTQAEYDDIGTPNVSTFYVIVG